MRRQAVTLSALAVTLIVAGGLVASCSVGSTDVVSYEISGDIGRLNVHDPVGKVEVTAGDGPIQVVETVRYAHDKPKTSHANDAGTLRLTSDGCSRHVGVCGVDYRVRVPAATSVQVTDAAGLVRLTRLAGDVDVNSAAGDVEASGLSSAHTTVRGDAGHISLRYATAPQSVQVTDQAGAIEIRVPKDATYAVDAQTTAGHTTVAVPVDPGSNRRITAHNSAGAITIGT